MEEPAEHDEQEEARGRIHAVGKARNGREGTTRGTRRDREERVCDGNVPAGVAQPREKRLSSTADATGRAPTLAIPSATSRSVETTMTGRPGGSARTS